LFEFLFYEGEKMTISGRKGESGFTLVELAIVMIIIGLLIGGILKGQELIANAAVTSTVAQVKGMESAISTFDDKYNALPGDITNVNNRLAGCAAAPCNVSGNGNGRIDTPALGTFPAVNQEGGVAFIHLAAADLITGIDVAAGIAAFGSALPEANIEGGFWIGHTQTGASSGLAAGSLRPGHYLVLNEDPITAGAATGITTTQAGRIDRKLDDGDPAAGDVWGVGTGCIAAGIYNESTDAGADCSMYIRVQG
jgi:prepilin-type N-terminal cleavage/methylation domain-containing protein